MAHIFTIFPAAAVLLVFSLSCASGPSVIITEGDSGKTVEVREGSTFDVKLKAQLGTGYGWQQKEAPDFVELRGAPKQEASNETVETGGFEFQVFSYNAAGKGKGDIVFEYRQPWNTKARAFKTYRVSLEIR